MADKKISALTAATTPLAGTEVLPIVQSGSTVKVSAANITAGRAVQAASLDLNGGSSTGGAIISGTISGLRASSTVFDIGDGSRFLALGANASTIGLIKLISASSDASIYSYIAESDSSSNLKVSTGNLVIGTAAKGIDFSANTHAAGMTSELLDWYEEGTFTPSFGADGGDPTATYTTAVGSYTRIGDMVYFNINLVINTISGGSGTLRIYGLPFVANASAGSWSCALGFIYNWVANANSFVVPASTDSVLVYKNAATNTIATPADLQASSYTSISGFYKTA